MEERERVQLVWLAAQIYSLVAPLLWPLQACGFPSRVLSEPVLKLRGHLASINAHTAFPSLCPQPLHTIFGFMLTMHLRRVISIVCNIQNHFTLTTCRYRVLVCMSSRIGGK
jgi:hypothetical protein